jgi:hypothetical protein
MDKGNFGDLTSILNEEGTQIYVNARGERYIRTLTDLINHLTKEKGGKGIILSTLWTANALTRRLSLTKSPRGSLIVLDTVSMKIGSGITDKEDFVFLPPPVSLETMMIGMERILEKYEHDLSFLLIDSLSFFERNFSSGQFSEFLGYVLNRMLEENIRVVVFDQEEDGSNLFSRGVASIMDHSIVMDKGGE